MYISVINNNDDKLDIDDHHYLFFDDLTAMYHTPPEEPTGIADIDNYMKSICLCHEEIGTDTLNELESRLQVLKTDELFYSTICNTLNSKKKWYEKNAKNSYSTTKKVQVEELLAWNNERLSMKILKHTFLHRKSEPLVTFKIADIITGKRYNFSDAGKYKQILSTIL